MPAKVIVRGGPNGARQSREEWRREFNELGRDAVRAELLGSRWDREKKAAARIWIETADALAWQSRNPHGDGGSPSLILRLRSARWWKYVGPMAGAAMGIGLLYQRLRGLF